MLVKVEGSLVNYLVEANPKRYKRYVAYEYGKKVIYLKLRKALYGCVESVLLWYKRFTDKLINQMGFSLNPYYTCVDNKMVNVKISHVDNNLVEDTVKELDGHFGEMTVTRGKHHTHVGMDIIFEHKAVKVHNIEYIKETIECFGEDIGSNAATSAKTHLFEQQDDGEPLNKAKHKVFHSCVAKLLYVAKRGRPDVLPTVSSLTTRVMKPNSHDWGKLRRLLQYL